MARVALRPPIAAHRAEAPQPDDGGATFQRASRCAHEFGRIAVHAPVTPGPHEGALSTARYDSDDSLESEADRVAEAVMREPTRSITHARAPSRPLVARTASGACSGQAGVVQRGVGTAGQHLGADTRAFFEARFGADLGDVRVHADDAAATSADALEARAYAVGRDVVFGAGEYAPASREGRTLLAHELTHVLQGATGLQRKPLKSAKAHHAKRITQKKLIGMARDPSLAHVEWKRLTAHEQIAVAEHMRQRYGVRFTDEFLAAAKSGATNLVTRTFFAAEHVGPSQLMAWGYRRGWNEFYGGGIDVDVWVHPTGKVARLDVSQQAAPAEPSQEPPVPDDEEDPPESPAAIDPAAAVAAWQNAAVQAAVQQLRDFDQALASMSRLCRADHLTPEAERAWRAAFVLSDMLYKAQLAQLPMDAIDSRFWDKFDELSRLLNKLDGECKRVHPTFQSTTNVFASPAGGGPMVPVYD